MYMKSLEEFYQEIVASDETKAALLKAADSKTLPEFLKARGVSASPDEFAAFLKQKTPVIRQELTDSETENVAGGFSWLSAVEFVYDLIKYLKNK